MDKKKYLIFDAGPLINFSMNGILYLLEDLKKEFKGDFVITKEVKSEIIDVPLTIKRFELEALQLDELFKKGVIKHADLSDSQINELRDIRNRLMQAANNMFRTKKTHLHLIDKGEAATLALSLILNNSPIAVDERTTRMLCENPENLKKLFEKKFHEKVEFDKKNFRFFQNYKIIRSAELVYIAYKKNLFRIKDSRALEAALYTLRYKGCAISEGEIEKLKRM